MISKNTTIGRLILDSIVSKSIDKTASDRFDKSEAVTIADGLQKVASLPYADGTYDSVRGIMKTASECINGMLKELDEAHVRVGEFEKVAEVRCLIDDMVSAGMIGEQDYQEKVAELSKKSMHEPMLQTIKVNLYPLICAMRQLNS